MGDLFQELKRRKVFRVAAAYVVIAWLLIQVTSTVLPTFNAPDWVNQSIILLFVIGFPVTIFLAWAYELSPDGIKSEADVQSVSDKPAVKLEENNADNVFDFSAPDKPSIAILPFKSLGSDPEYDFLAEGIRFGIQATLVQVSGLFLINAVALNAYRNTEKSPVTAGVELDVDYILEGSVQQSGDKVRLAVQLTDIHNQQTVWAQHYDGILDDVFNLQDEITREVVSSLNVKLLDSEIARIWFEKLISPEAREYYYRGLMYFYELNNKDNAHAREMFEQLYCVEPESVFGPGGVALTHWLDGFVGWTADPEGSMAQAAEWAVKAMEYEDNNGLGHAVYGYTQLLEGNYDEALEICTKGVKLRASCPVAHGLLGIVLNYSGQPELAINRAKEALLLEKGYPVWLINLLAAAYRDSGEIKFSISAALEAIKLHKDNEARLILCSDYGRMGEAEKAQSIAAEITANDPGFTLAGYVRSHPYKDPGILENILSNLRLAGLPE